MTQTAYTPGPWQSLEILDGIAIKDNRNVTIAICDYATDADAIEVSEWETEANGRVIAAAPDMLHALECLLFYAADIHSEDLDLEVYEQARAAIAKAKGGAA
jgi:hypothetical protein